MAEKTVQQLEAEGAQLAKNKQQLGEINSAEEARRTIQGHIIDSQKEQLSTLQRIKQDYAGYHSELSDSVIVAEQQLTKLKEQGTASADLIKQAEEQVLLSKENLDYAIANKDVTEEHLDSLGEELSVRQRINGAMDEAADKSDRANDSISNSLTMLTNVSANWEDTGAGAFAATAATEGFGAAIGKVAVESKKLLSTANILGSGLLQIGVNLMQMVFALDGARAEFNRTTGAAGKYDEVISRNYETTLAMGGSIEQQNASLQSLRNNLTSFSKLGAEATDETVNLVTAMQLLGASTDDSVKTLEFAQTVMGKTGKESQQFGADLKGFADKFDMDFNVVMGNFAQHMDTFAAEGENAGKEFMRMQAIAKKTGIELGNLIELTEQYDTISGAAAATAKLNAALGGAYLSSNDMMNKSLSERMIAIRGAIDASGKDFKSMTRAERQYYTNALGLKSVTAATKLFGDMSAEEMARVAKEAEDAGMSIEEMMNQTEHGMTAGQKFSAVLASLADIAAPIATLFNGIATAFLAIRNSLGGGLVGTVAALGAAFLALRMVPKLLGHISTAGSGMAAKFATAMPKTSKAMGSIFGKGPAGDPKKKGKAISTSIRQIGKAAQDTWRGLLALGLTFILISVAVFIAAKGVAELVRSFEGFSATQILAISVAIGVFGLMMVKLLTVLAGVATAAPAVATGLVPLGFAMLLIGGAVALAAWGMGFLVKAFKSILGKLGDFGTFVGLMVTLAVASVGVGAGGLLAMGGLIAMSLGLLALAFSLFFISTDDLTALGNMMQGLGKVAEHAGTGMGSAVPQVKSLMHTLLGLGMWIRMFKLEDSLRSMGDGFWMMGFGAERAVTTLPLLASPLQMIAEATGKWADNLGRLMGQLPMFVMLMGGLALALMGIGWAWFGILAVTGLAYGLAESLSALPESKAGTFTRMIETLEDATPAMQQITPAVVDNVTGLVEQAHAYQSAVSYGGIFDGFADMLGLASSTSKRGGGGGGDTAPTTVILELDHKELGRVVDKLVSKKHRVSVSE
jgi:hypothetical protein